MNSPIDLGDYGGVGGKIFPATGHTQASLVVVSGPMVFVDDVFRGDDVFREGTERHTTSRSTRQPWRYGRQLSRLNFGVG